mmetsp:Transcript_45971/g.82778  ORF Transcript_45971/g.82778 Transcript_45971/m.82778 type:complete len:200 (-) Transcript_45971:76-675(-)
MAIGDGTIREKRGEDQVHLLLHVLVTHDVEVGLLLSSKRGIRKILSSCRRSHCKGELLITTAHTLPLGLQLLLEVLLEGCVHDLVADVLSNLHELVDVCVDALVAQLVVDVGVDTTLVKKLLVSMGSGAEASRHRHSHVRELGNHLTEGCTLAANLVHIGVSQLLQRNAHTCVLTTSGPHSHSHLALGRLGPACLAGTC